MTKPDKKYPFLLLFASSILSLLVFSIFYSATNNEFVDLDDLGYIVENRHLDVLNWQTVIWAFTSFHEANWHPLTMLSLALDKHIFGESPYGFHLVNIIIHSCTTFLSCFVFYSFIKLVNAGTKLLHKEPTQIIAAVFSALLFAVHPLRVESVVWASERKDVLCLFFIVMAIWFYLRFNYHLKLSPEGKFSKFGTYWATLLFCTLALMSKPAAVSLPFILLLIDYYPLGRITDKASFLRVVVEKTPFFIITFIATILTIAAQQYAINMAPQVNFASRLLVASKALVFYLWKMLIPISLVPYYPHTGNVTTADTFEYLFYISALLIIISFSLVQLKKQRPSIFMIFVFYFITLLPMLGIIQVGGQWIADRYTYLPALGISLLFGSWGVFIVSSFLNSGKSVIAVAIGLMLITQLTSYIVMTHKQIAVWYNNETLASREIENFPHKSGAAYYSRAKYRKEHRDCENALLDVDEALAIALRNGLSRKYADLSFSRAEVFVCLGRFDEAKAALEWAIQTSSGDERAGYLEYLGKLK